MNESRSGSRRRLELDEPIAFDEAYAIVRAQTPVLPAEDVALGEAGGRVLARAVVAPHPVPPFENSIVDGFAVRSADVRDASPERPVELDVVADLPAGGEGCARVESGTAARIMTGAPVPPGCDAIVMLEWTSFTASNVRVERPAAAGQFIRRIGEDIPSGAVVLEPGVALSPASIGMLASLGQSSVCVARRPVVAVLATGDELLGVDEPLAPGKIRSSNSWTLAGQAREAGAIVRDLGIARDDVEDLSRRLEEGRQADVLVTSGGVSVGDRDEVQRVLVELGFRRSFWRVAASPGKPLLFGRLGSTLVFGIPGNPVSSMVAFENFVRPTLRRMQGAASPGRPRVRAVLEDAISGPQDRRHFARVRLRWEEGRFHAAEVRPHGSGNLRSMVLANALAILPEGRKQADRGEELEIVMLGEPDCDAS